MKTAVITFDIINEICHPQGKAARFADRIQHHNIIGNINKLTRWAREQGHLVIHVRLGFRASYQDGSTTSPIFVNTKKNGILKQSEWGSQFCEQLARDENDVEVLKHRVSGFYGTDLDLILRANKIDKIIIVGVALNNAVELTAREAHDRDFRVVIVCDAVEGVSDEENAASFNFLTRISDLVNIEDISR